MFNVISYSHENVGNICHCINYISMLAFNWLMVVVECLPPTQPACHVDVYLYHFSYVIPISFHCVQTGGWVFLWPIWVLLFTFDFLTRSTRWEGWVKAWLDASRPRCFWQYSWSHQWNCAVRRRAGAPPWTVHGPAGWRGYTSLSTCFPTMGSHLPPPGSGDLLFEVSFKGTAMVCGDMVETLYIDCTNQLFPPPGYPVHTSLMADRSCHRK